MKALAMEFRKTRRRRVWLIVAALLAVQLLWAFWGFRNLDAEDLRQGWLLCLYQFPLLNSIMMPVVAAVVASRLCDVEHKGQALRLLHTVMPAGRLFDAKFLCGALYLAAAALLQVIVILLNGCARGFAGAAPLPMLGLYLLFTTAASLTVLALQQALSLLFVNQMAPLAAGLVGGFAGLFLLYLPRQLAYCIPWGYYGVLMLAGMDWDRATRVTDYYQAGVNWPGFLLLAAMFCVIYAVGRALFVRKEL